MSVVDWRRFKTNDVANQPPAQDYAEVVCILIEFLEPRFIAV